MIGSICQLHINGEEHQLVLDPWDTLSYVLRERLDLTGTKEGCQSGECGACTVLVDGKPAMACLLLALEMSGKQITTIEGLAHGARLDTLQETFLTHGATQCGFCTPGMILSARALLDSGKPVTEETVAEALAGNHCRCTGYTKITEAVLAAAELERAS